VAIKTLLIASGVLGLGVAASGLLYGQRKYYINSIKKWKRSLLLDTANKDDQQLKHDDDVCGFIQRW
jgi:hypothetical protein